MKKNETYNEVPLKQFIEFFMQSQVSMQIDYFEYFLIACRNVCLIDVAGSHETGDEQPQPGKTQKITTVRLKNSVLKELILDSKYNPLSQQGAGPGSNSSSWLLEYKKRIPDFQFQNDIIYQLLDIFISQVKGQKMNILKCLKANQLECENDFKLAIDGNSLKIESEQGGSCLTT